MELLNIRCRLLTGQEVELSVPGDIRIRDVKELIADECHLAADSQRLIFKGQMFMDGNTLGSYGVTSGSVIHVIENSPGPSQGAQPSDRFGDGQGSVDFSDAMASSMGKLMGQFLKPQGSDGDSGRDWDKNMDNMKPFLMQGMKLAEQMARGDNDFGKFASKMFSNFMKPPMMHQDPSRSSYYSGSSFGDEQSHRVANGVRHAGESKGDSASERAETVVNIAKYAITKVSDYLSGTSRSAPQTNGDVKAPSAGMTASELEASLSLTKSSDGIFMKDPKSMASKLPWELLEQLEKVISSVDGTEPPKEDRLDVGHFMERYGAAVRKSGDAIKEVTKFCEGTCAMQSEKLMAMSMMFSLQAALQAEMAMITTVLSKQASRLNASAEADKSATLAESSQDAGSSSTSQEEKSVGSGMGLASKGKQSKKFSGFSARYSETDLYYVPEDYGKVGGKREEDAKKFVSMLTGMSGMQDPFKNPLANRRYGNEPKSSLTDDDILEESTELRTVLNQYRNSTGFKSRMDDFARKTKTLGEEYCTGCIDE
ncbi:hypothetical protein BgAZ_403310 [Babesia gibsoni]|uniref:Ubiquitin-like domain-containing protein n=1 Tax=Babesia gibsoni TaxID=33632 RepID=A0AAD8LP34_BABGI|nr:hypothetical protein BgAZ_403310 [Babesia gibsoni]